MCQINIPYIYPWIYAFLWMLLYILKTESLLFDKIEDWNCYVYTKGENNQAGRVLMTLCKTLQMSLKHVTHDIIIVLKMMFCFNVRLHVDPPNLQVTSLKHKDVNLKKSHKNESNYKLWPCYWLKQGTNFVQQMSSVGFNM